MKKLKDLLIIPPGDGMLSKKRNKHCPPAEMAYGDVNDLPEGYIAIDLDIVNLMREVTTVPVPEKMDQKTIDMRLDFLRRHGILADHQPINASESGREYLKRFKPGAQSRPQQNQTITETELKKLIVEECNERAAKEAIEFEWTNDAIFMVRNMMYYFGNHPDCDWPAEKGLLLSGNVGVGKTWIFEIFQQVVFKHLRSGGKRFKMAECRTLYEDYTADRKTAREKYLAGSWCFDDLGNEPLEHKDFGNSSLPVEEILIARYGQLSINRNFTHISTNLSLDEIRERYGLRMFDRLMKMCHPVEWQGKSKRR